MPTNETKRERFGERAVRMGLVSDEDVRKALLLQRTRGRDGRPHKLIGLIMIETGALSNDELLRILKTYEDESDHVVE